MGGKGVVVKKVIQKRWRRDERERKHLAHSTQLKPNKESL